MQLRLRPAAAAGKTGKQPIAGIADLVRDVFACRLPASSFSATQTTLEALCRYIRQHRLAVGAILLASRHGS